MKDKEEEIARLNQILFEMSDEVLGMKKESRKSYNEKHKIKIALKKRNDYTKLFRENDSLREVIEDKSDTLCDAKNYHQKEVSRVKDKGKRGGSPKCSLWMLQLILEVLVNGTPRLLCQPTLCHIYQY